VTPGGARSNQEGNPRRSDPHMQERISREEDLYPFVPEHGEDPRCEAGPRPNFDRDPSTTAADGRKTLRRNELRLSQIEDQLPRCARQHLGNHAFECVHRIEVKFAAQEENNRFVITVGNVDVEEGPVLQVRSLIVSKPRGPSIRHLLADHGTYFFCTRYQLCSDPETRNPRSQIKSSTRATIHNT
jgi:hypothetical protein